MFGSLEHTTLEDQMQTKSSGKKATGPLKSSCPVFPIGVAAKMLGVHPRTLRIYESEGLLRPKYHGPRRLFSQNDIQWVICLRSMIHDEGISIPGVKKLLDLAPCWEIMDCPPEIHETCEAKVDRSKTGQQCVNCGHVL